MSSTTSSGSITGATTTQARTATGRARRGSARRAAPAPPPLGSLTQGGSDGRGAGEPCATCASTSVTNLAITLTDGTPARFTSCRTCGERRWVGSGEALSIVEVLARATRA